MLRVSEHPSLIIVRWPAVAMPTFNMFPARSCASWAVGMVLIAGLNDGICSVVTCSVVAYCRTMHIPAVRCSVLQCPYILPPLWAYHVYIYLHVQFSNGMLWFIACLHVYIHRPNPCLMISWIGLRCSPRRRVACLDTPCVLRPSHLHPCILVFVGEECRISFLI